MKHRLPVFIVLLFIIVLGCLCACSDSSTISDILPTSITGTGSPVFSHPAGSYDDKFTLTISGGGTIRYTLDGSEPTEESDVFPSDGLVIKDRSKEPNVLAAISPKLFTAESDHTAPRVTKCTVVRAASFYSDGSRSKTVTATYLVGLDYEGIKVVSLVLDSDSLFDYETGIYVFGAAYDDWYAEDPQRAKDTATWLLEGNFSQKGREWEREVCMQLITEDGTLGIEQDMGLRMMGAASRRYYQKSFRLIAREDYGSKHFEYPIIRDLVTDSTGEPLEKYKSFLLRNGGNDNGYAFLRDPLIQSLVSGRDFATQDSEPAIVFINGEYWGLYAITEDYSDNYVQYNYGVDNENVMIVKNWAIEEGFDEEIDIFEEINGAIYGKNFTYPADYRWLSNRMDMDSFIDYAAVELYVNNCDGPFQGNNWRIWRARDVDPENPYADGRWRWMLYDADMSLSLYGNGSDYITDTLKNAIDSNWGWGLMLKKLLDNEGFRQQFVTTFMDLRNTVFYHEDAIARLTEMKLEYAPYVYEQYERNGPAWVLQWSDIDTRFDEETNAIRKFLNGRYGYAPKMLSNNLELGELYKLTLRCDTPEGGKVVVNTVTPDLSDGAWEGDYFSDYPITVTAKPAEGYVFAGWRGSLGIKKEAILTINLTENITLSPVFEQQ